MSQSQIRATIKFDAWKLFEGIDETIRFMEWQRFLMASWEAKHEGVGLLVKKYPYRTEYVGMLIIPIDTVIEIKIEEDPDESDMP